MAVLPHAIVRHFAVLGFVKVPIRQRSAMPSVPHSAQTKASQNLTPKRGPPRPLLSSHLADCSRSQTNPHLFLLTGYRSGSPPSYPMFLAKRRRPQRITVLRNALPLASLKPAANPKDLPAGKTGGPASAQRMKRAIFVIKRLLLTQLFYSIDIIVS